MPFQKGKSGNPSGRPKKVLELVELARESCPDAIEKAKKLLKDSDGKVAMAAAVFLRDTGMGRPSQVEFDLAQVPDERLLEEVRRRADAAKQRAAASVPGAVGAGADGVATH